MCHLWRLPNLVLMPFTSPRLVELGCVGAAVALTGILFLPSAADPVNVIKLVVLLLAGVGCMAAVTLRLVRERLVDLPVGAYPMALAGFIAALFVALMASPSTTAGLLGAPGRLSGFLLYLAAATVAVSTLRGGLAGLSSVEAAISAAAVFTASYGLLQYVGIDAISWANEFNPVIASLGNPNFASAYLGACAPLLVAVTVRRDQLRWLRTCAAVVAAGTLLAALLSGAVQGPIAATAGLTVVLLAWLRDRPDPRRRRQLVSGLASIVGLGVALLALGAAGAGPLSAIFGAGNFDTRKWYWSAALTMWREQPLLGVGLDHYGRSWGIARPMSNVTALGGGDFTDAAHSVPLHLLATGGLVVALAYLAFVSVTLLALVRGLNRLEGDARLRLAGVGGAWVAYQVQSLVSIDQVPLVVLNVVLSAAVVVASGTARLKRVRLPGALPPEPERPAGGRRAPSLAPRVRATTAGDVVLLSMITILGGALLWLALIPLRADVAVRSGDDALRRGDGNASLAAYDKAIELLPGRSPYWMRKASLMTNVQPATALDAYDGAIQADPSNAAALRSAGALAEAEGQLERARGYFRRAVDVDPYNPGTVTAAATFELRHGGAAAAKELLEKAVARTPGQAALWTPLGDARQVLGDEQGAIAAYERALALDPTIARATEELTKLRA